MARDKGPALVWSGRRSYVSIVITPVLTVLLLASGVPAIRVALRRPVWSEVRRRPVLGAVAAIAGAAVLWFGWVLCRRVPAALPLVTGVAVTAALLAWFRARPRFGRALPPGSLGVRQSLRAIEDIGFYAREGRRWGGVFKMAQFHRPVVCVTDLPLGLEVLETHRADLEQPRLAFGRLSPGNYIEFMNDERHARYRGILQSSLRGRLIASCRDGVAAAIRTELAALASEGRDGGADPNPTLTRIGFVAMLRVMCGVPVDDARMDEVYGWFRELGTIRAFTEQGPEERTEPYGRLVEWVRGRGTEIRDRLAAGADVPPSALSEIIRADPAHLEDDTILGNLVLIVHVTHSNVRGLLGWILKEAIDNPACAEEIRVSAVQAADSTRPRALATNFVNETLRRHQSEYFYREVVRPIEFSGYHIPKGWLLRVCVREAHDDPDVFEDPLTFRPERFDGRKYSRTEYCPFSDGAHSCFGAGLAVMIATVFLIELTTGFRVSVTNDGPVERDGNRHWSHWRPNARLRVALSPQRLDPMRSSTD